VAKRKPRERKENVVVERLFFFSVENRRCIEVSRRSLVLPPFSLRYFTHKEDNRVKFCPKKIPFPSPPPPPGVVGRFFPCLRLRCISSSGPPPTLPPSFPRRLTLTGKKRNWVFPPPFFPPPTRRKRHGFIFLGRMSPPPLFSPFSPSYYFGHMSNRPGWAFVLGVCVSLYV